MGKLITKIIKDNKGKVICPRQEFEFNNTARVNGHLIFITTSEYRSGVPLLVPECCVEKFAY